MTFYEVMMRRAARPDEHMVVVASGMNSLIAAIDFLDQKARDGGVWLLHDGGIRETSQVQLWHEVRVSGAVVTELVGVLQTTAARRFDTDALGSLGPIDPAAEYDIYLSEV